MRPPRFDTRSVSLTKAQARLLLSLLEAEERRGVPERQRLELERVWNKLPHLWARGERTTQAWATTQPAPANPVELGREVTRGVWRLTELGPDPDRPQLGRLVTIGFELTNGYRESWRAVWERDLLDLVELVHEINPSGALP